MGDQSETSQPWKLAPSFDAFVAAGAAQLLRSAYLLTGNREQAEDLLQVALVRVARRWDVARTCPDAYAHRVLVNLIHDRRRALSRRVRTQRLDDHEERSPLVEDDTRAAVDRIALVSALRSLPARQREVVVLRFFADLSVADTASAMGATEGTVKTHTSRALSTLRQVLSSDTADAIAPKGPTLC